MKLTPLLQRKPLELSGGQQQRTALARAIVKGAALVLLDEPLANLDYKLREELREELPRIFSATGAIFVYATTEPVEALLLGGSTATLAEGASPSSAHARGLPPAEQPGDGADLLRSADQHAGRPEVRRGAGLGCRRICNSPRSARSQRSPTATTRSASARTTCSCAAPAGSAAVTGTVALTEITGSESFIMSISPARAGWRSPTACTTCRSDSRSSSISSRTLLRLRCRGRALRRPGMKRAA